MTELSPELQRAEEISGKLYKAIAVARSTYHSRISFDLSDAEELLQLLEDSLKTAKQILKSERGMTVRA